MNEDFNVAELRHFQISSPAVETTSFRNRIKLKDLNGIEVWKLLDLISLKSQLKLNKEFNGTEH